MLPSSMTRIVSASRIVDSRWAMTNEVRSLRSAAIASCTSTSVRVSTDEVASSRMSSAGCAKNARAIVMSWRSPADTFAPSSSIRVSYPSGSVCTNRSTKVARAASFTSSSVASRRPYRMFSMMVPPNRTASCSTMPTWPRSTPRSRARMSTPSSRMRPASMS